MLTLTMYLGACFASPHSYIENLTLSFHSGMAGNNVDPDETHMDLHCSGHISLRVFSLILDLYSVC